MLEKIDLSKNMTKKEVKPLMEKLDMTLSKLQREARELKIPVMILFEGWGAAGKGTLINRLIQPMDPRGFKVFTIQEESEEEYMRPFLWRFWTKTPAKGRIHVFDRSWYRKVINDRIDNKCTKEELKNAYGDIVCFEETLSVDNCLIIKLFLHISQKEQKKRFKKLEASPETKWRVTEADWRHNEQYDDYMCAYEEMLENTDTDFAPWTIIEATDREYAQAKILTTVVNALQEKINDVRAKAAEKEAEKEAQKADVPEEAEESVFKTSVLDGVDLNKTMTKAAYKKKLKELQGRMEKLHSKMYHKRIPVVLAFEGWDAAGKGGAIRRLTETLDLSKIYRLIFINLI